MIDLLAVAAVAALVIGRQLLGEPLRGRRVLLLPAVLAVVGLTRLRGHGSVTAADIAFLTAGALVALVIGAGQGATMRLESRDGGLWGRMPVRGLWWWAALVGARVALTLSAGASGAHLAASAAPIVLMLGVNRLGQAGVITLRALGSGIPFSPEKDGRVFLADRTGSWAGPGRPADSGHGGRYGDIGSGYGGTGDGSGHGSADAAYDGSGHGSADAAYDVSGHGSADAAYGGSAYGGLGPRSGPDRDPGYPGYGTRPRSRRGLRRRLGPGGLGLDGLGRRR